MGRLSDKLGQFFNKSPQNEKQESDSYMDGFENGSTAAQEDLCDGTPDGWKDRTDVSREFAEEKSPMDFYQPSITDNVTVPPATPKLRNIYFWVAKDIALKSEELNPGENEYFAARGDYISGYQDGYGERVEIEADQYAPQFNEPHEITKLDCDMSKDHKIETDSSDLYGENINNQLSEPEQEMER